MRNEIENIFQLPIPTDIKFCLYEQLYRHVYTIPDDLKQDIITYNYIEFVLAVYKAEYDMYPDQNNYYLDWLFYDLSLEFQYEANFSINIMSYTDMMKAIKHLWRQMTPNLRLKFLYDAERIFN